MNGGYLTRAAMVRSFASLSDGNAWQTRQGTLTPRALEALLAACRDLSLHPRDCAAEIGEGGPPFSSIPAPAREEADLLLQACDRADKMERCRQEIENLRFVRDLPIGRVAPKPLRMKENLAVTFTAFVERTSQRVTPGQDGIRVPRGEDTGEDADVGPAQTYTQYTRDTCFELEAGKDFKVEGENPQCPPFLRSGRHVFAPEWTVTPLAGEARRELRLTRILKRNGGVIEETPQHPYPIYIDVELEPPLHEKIITFLTAWTGVAEAARLFILAAEAVVAALMGFTLFKIIGAWWRRRQGRTEGDGGES